MTEPILITNYAQLDALIEERVFEAAIVNLVVGHYRYRDTDTLIPKYSRDIAAAWVLVERLRLTIMPFELDQWWAYSNLDTWVESVQDTAPLAICLAALKSVNVEVELKLS